MNVLLDTNVFLASLYDTKSLDTNCVKTIRNAQDVFVSQISMWEVALLKKSNRLGLKHTIEQIQNIAETVGNFRFIANPLSVDILSVFVNLPIIKNHNDPFDRIIISTAMAHKLVILTSDKKFRSYKVDIQFVTPVTI